MSRTGVALYVLVDALGWELLKDRRFLDEILTERCRVETILGYSSGAIPTLLTGQTPQNHGHWNLFYRSPETSPFRWTRLLRVLPTAVQESRVTRRLVRDISRRLSGYSGYFAIYNLPLHRIHFYDICETADIYQPGGLAPARSLFDILKEHGIGYECFNYHDYTDTEILDLAPVRLQASNRTVYFLYLSGLDAYLHFHVADVAGVTARLRWYEDRLRRIYEAARARWGEVRMFVFSDHGMTPILTTRDLIQEVNKLNLSIPEDYLPAFDSTMARFWLFSDRAESRIRACLETLRCGQFLSATELKELGLDFPDDRYGHLVFVMDPGVLIYPSDMGRVRFDGMHGFHPAVDPFASAVLLSNQPPAFPVRHLTDVLPVLMADLGLEVRLSPIRSAP